MTSNSPNIIRTPDVDVSFPLNHSKSFIKTNNFTFSSATKLLQDTNFTIQQLRQLQIRPLMTEIRSTFTRTMPCSNENVSEPIRYVQTSPV